MAQFFSPRGIAIDRSGNLYVCDSSNHRIQKFTSGGVFITKWGTVGSGDGEFYFPRGIAIDESGNLYLTDTWNDRIQKFTSEGVFIAKWGIGGTGEGQFLEPRGIAVDRSGNVYVADTWSHRFQKFTSDGFFVNMFGTFGNDIGYLNAPEDLGVNSRGKIYISDIINDRIQSFREIVLTEGVTKAIIIAGGGPFAGNNLWEATQMSANFAYRTLTYQGFTKESIYYLTSDTDLDLDSNGVWMMWTATPPMLISRMLSRTGLRMPMMCSFIWWTTAVTALFG